MTPKAHSLITPVELHQRLQQGPAPVLVDVLPASHFERVHLPGAANVCVYEVGFLNGMAGLVPDREALIALYGSRGGTADALTAAEKLSREGYRHLLVLEGGLDGWRRAGLPLEGERPDDPLDPQTTPCLQGGVYRIEPDQSTVRWTGRNANTSHYGTVGLVSGELTVHDGVLTGACEIDPAAITNESVADPDLRSVLIAHLLSDDFFFTSRYPRAVFRITAGTLLGEPLTTAPNMRIEGELELRGVTAGLGFPATVTQPDGERVVAVAHFDWDRTKWGVIYGSARFFEHLGMHAVFDLVSLEVRLIAVRQAGGQPALP